MIAPCEDPRCPCETGKACAFVLRSGGVADDVRTLEECADELMRQGSAGHAVKLWALALRMRAALRMPPEIVSVARG